MNVSRDIRMIGPMRGQKTLGGGHPGVGPKNSPPPHLELPKNTNSICVSRDIRMIPFLIWGGYD